MGGIYKIQETQRIQVWKDQGTTKKISEKEKNETMFEIIYAYSVI